MKKSLVFAGWLVGALLAELLVIAGSTGFGLAVLLSTGAVWGAAFLAGLLFTAGTVLVLVWAMYVRDRLARKGLVW